MGVATTLFIGVFAGVEINALFTNVFVAEVVFTAKDGQHPASARGLSSHVTLNMDGNMMTTVYLSSDHAGIELRQAVATHLADGGYKTVDLGPQDGDSVDYPEYGARLAEAMQDDPASRGIAICGSGIGISIAANRFEWVRAALVNEVKAARLCREHNDANVLALGQRLTARIREDLFQHALALSLRFHDGMPVGKLLTRLTSDVDALAEVFGSGAVGVLGDLVSLVVIATTMLLIDWRLGLLLLFTQIPVTIAVLWLQRRYRIANYRGA